MKTTLFVAALLAGGLLFCACGGQGGGTAAATGAPADGGQSTVQDETSAPDVVRVAVGSPDHTTLVAALKAAELVDALSNAGPFTVFAPTNAAFDKLPKGTVDDLLKPENKEKLADILSHHVYVGVVADDLYSDGRVLNQVDGTNVTLGRQGDALTIEGAKVLATVRATNGIVYVIDSVVLPK